MILEAAVNTLLVNITGLILLDPLFAMRSRQDGFRKTGSYGSIGFMSDTSVGWEQRELENNDFDLDLTETLSGVRELMYDISFFRDLAYDNARKVRTAFMRESVNALLSEAGLGLVRRSAVRDISQTFENTFEQRAQFDIVLSAVGTDQDIIRSILEVNIAGEFQARGLKHNFNIDIDIS